ncbi:MAG: tRNA 2-thiouridine(34) synthase MnmA [Clostridiales bacterium]|nr:tRNA 2-thiouridine(34) synthase MnmA [Clostridiales bacterium]
MRITVGMSGGVDSSVAAWLLKQEGHEVTGIYMVNWEEEDESGVCTAVDDYDDVRRCCDVIDIPYYTVNFSKQYRERVFSVFLEEYKAGRTPNPDVLCNSEIKFNAFLDFAIKTDAEALATGHYCQLAHTDDGVKLMRGADENKDQTYFLCGLTQAQLERAMFPIGALQKSRVRELAQKAGLPTASKKDSTGICFIGERNFSRFIGQYIKKSVGNMVDIDSGKVMAQHEGLFHYTIGQRKGIGIGGSGSGEPWFVAKKDPATGTLYICQGKNHPALFSRGLTADKMNWIAGDAPSNSFDCTIKFRYRQKDVPCRVEVKGRRIYVRFESPQRAVTPGQYAVLYQGEECLGGGIIEQEIK